MCVCVCVCVCVYVRVYVSLRVCVHTCRWILVFYTQWKLSQSQSQAQWVRYLLGGGGGGGLGWTVKCQCLAGHHNQFICCVILDSDSNCALWLHLVFSCILWCYIHVLYSSITHKKVFVAADTSYVFSFV